MLDKEAIREKEDLPVEKVQVDAWEDFVYVGTMTGDDLNIYQESLVNTSDPDDDGQNLKNSHGLMAALTICDEHGVKMFTPEDAVWLGKKSAKALNPIIKKAHELSGLEREEREEHRKNSDGGQTSDSGTD